jgi:hypothetical protein
MKGEERESAIIGVLTDRGLDVNYIPSSNSIKI